MSEASAVLGETVNIGSANAGAVTTQIAIAHIVNINDDDIGLFRRVNVAAVPGGQNPRCG